MKLFGVSTIEKLSAHTEFVLSFYTVLVAREPSESSPVFMIPSATKYGYPMWVHEGRQYFRYREFNGALYLRCRLKKVCKARARISKERRFYLSSPHTCSEFF